MTSAASGRLRINIVLHIPLTPESAAVKTSRAISHLWPGNNYGRALWCMDAVIKNVCKNDEQETNDMASISNPFLSLPEAIIVRSFTTLSSRKNITKPTVPDISRNAGKFRFSKLHTVTPCHGWCIVAASFNILRNIYTPLFVFIVPKIKSSSLLY